MENSKTIDDSIDSLGTTLTDEMKRHWTETRKWGLFFAALGIFFTFLILIAAVALFMQSAAIDNSPGMPFSSRWIAGMYIILGIFYAIPTYYLFMFNSRAKAAVSQDSIEMFEASMAFMKLLFRSLGILTISMIVLYAIFVVVLVQNAGTMLP